MGKKLYIKKVVKSIRLHKWKCKWHFESLDTLSQLQRLSYYRVSMGLHQGHFPRNIKK